MKPLAAPTAWALALGLGLAASSTLIALHEHRDVVPLYDGVGFPDEPYRYVTPPAGSAPTKPVKGASVTSALLGDGSNGPITVSTDEKGPQATVQLRIGVLQAGPGATKVIVSLQPVTEEAAPSNGNVLGNVYKVSFTDDRGRDVPTAGVSRYYVSMRIPQGTREPVAIERFAQGAWTTLQTTQTGADVYSAYVPGAGELAPVLITGDADRSLAATAGKGSGSSGLIIALVVAVIVVVGVTLFTMRTRALRLAGSPQPPGDQVGEDMSSGGGSG